jgi:hypothetical protein
MHAIVHNSLREESPRNRDPYQGVVDWVSRSLTDAFTARGHEVGKKRPQLVNIRGSVRNRRSLDLVHRKEPGVSATRRAVCRSEHSRAVATALPGPTVRRHWGLRLAGSLGVVLFVVTISAVLLEIVSVEYRLDPVTGCIYLTSAFSVGQRWL